MRVAPLGEPGLPAQPSSAGSSGSSGPRVSTSTRRATPCPLWPDALLREAERVRSVSTWKFKVNIYSQASVPRTLVSRVVARGPCSVPAFLELRRQRQRESSVGTCRVGVQRTAGQTLVGAGWQRESSFVGAVWSGSLPCWAAAGDCKRAYPGTPGRRSGPHFRATSSAFQLLAAFLYALLGHHRHGCVRCQRDTARGGRGSVREAPTGVPWVRVGRGSSAR